MRDVGNDSMDPLVTIEQVAAFLQVSKDTVYRLAKTGSLPGAKIGQQWRFLKSEVDAWLEGRKNVSESEQTEDQGSDFQDGN